MGDDWEVNVKKISKKFNLKNLLTVTGDNYRDKRIIINKDYLTSKFDNNLRSHFSFVNFDNNNNYLNFSETELSFLYDDNNKKEFTLEYFNKITYNKDDIDDLTLRNLKITNSNIVTCFKIKNNNKILNIFVYEQYLEKINKKVYIILSYFDRKNIRVMII